jgi:hypothetical protein
MRDYETMASEDTVEVVETVDVLSNMQIMGNTFEVNVPLDGEWTDRDVDQFILMESAIRDKIETGERPAGTLKKALERVEHHKEQLVDAVTILVQTYTRMTDPPSRKGLNKGRAKFNAQRALLEGMTDKMLKDFARIHIGDSIDDMILPDDRSECIAQIIDVFEKKDEGTEQSDEVSGK